LKYEFLFFLNKNGTIPIFLNSDNENLDLELYLIGRTPIRICLSNCKIRVDHIAEEFYPFIKQLLKCISNISNLNSFNLYFDIVKPDVSKNTLDLIDKHLRLSAKTKLIFSREPITIIEHFPCKILRNIKYLKLNTLSMADVDILEGLTYIEELEVDLLNDYEMLYYI
jgi:hypothetical protein